LKIFEVLEKFAENVSLESIYEELKEFVENVSESNFEELEELVTF